MLLELYFKDDGLLADIVEDCVIQEINHKAKECLNILTLIDSDCVMRYYELRSG